MRKGQLKEAISYYNRSLELSRKFEDNWGIASAYAELGGIYQEYKDFTKALEYFLNALEKFQEIEEKDHIAHQLTNIAIVLQEMGEYKQAIDRLQQANTIYKAFGYDYFWGSNQMLLGLIYRKQERWEDAENHFNQAEISLKKFKDQSALGDLYHYRGTAAFEQKNFPAALILYQKSLQTKKEINNKRGQISALNSIAKTYLAQNNLSLANSYALEAHNLIDENTALSNQKETVDILSQINKQTGSLEKALQYLESFTEIKDSILNQERAQKSAILQHLLAKRMPEGLLIQWTPSPDARFVKEWRIYRAKRGENYQLIRSIEKHELTYFDKTVESGQFYSYLLTAVTTNTQESQSTQTLSIQF